jgi:hypothetical protein
MQMHWWENESPTNTSGAAKFNGFWFEKSFLRFFFHYSDLFQVSDSLVKEVSQNMNNIRSWLVFSAGIIFNPNKNAAPKTG